MASIKSLAQSLTNTGKFSSGAARALARYVCETDSERNISDLCEQFTEHASMIEAAEFYGFPSDDEDFEEEDACEWLEGNTLVIQFARGVVVSRF